MNPDMVKAFDYYQAHQADLVSQYGGKYIVIRDDTVLGAYDSDLEAVEATTKVYPLGTFLIQKCELGSDSLTMTFHSRVAFA